MRGGGGKDATCGDAPRGKLPDNDECLNKISNGFHVVGEIAVLRLPPELDGCKKAAALAVLSQNKYIRTVLNRTSRLEGEQRVASFEVLAGMDKTITEHREYGFVYRLDVARVFFNSHLGYERARVAAQVRPGERALVPFAGVGPFAIPIAARKAEVMAVEKSREACRWLAENARLNGVEERMTVLNADAKHMAQMLKPEFDRAVIPAPYGMDWILETVSSKVKTGGMLHFYTFKKRCQIEEVIEGYEGMGLEVLFYRRCGNVAPAVSRWAFDMLKC